MPQHAGMLACIYRKAARRRAELPSHNSSQLCQAGLKPSTETHTKSKPCASSSPMLVPQQQEIIEDQVGGTKILREEKHIYWNKDLHQKLVGEGNERQSGEWSRANSGWWPRMQGREEGKETQSWGKEEEAWPGWKKLTSLRSARGGSREGAPLSYLTRKGTSATGWSLRV